MFGVNIVWQIGNVIVAIILIIKETTLSELNKNGMFLILRLSGGITIIIFMIVGLVLSAKVRELPKNTVYEVKVAIKQKEAIRRLWIVIKYFMFVCTFLVFFDIYSFN